MVEKSTFTLPGLTKKKSDEIIKILQVRLSSYNDLHLTLKHAHWNVVGAHFIGVHEMIDPQVELVRGYADAVAERIAAMGASPGGRVSDIERARTWDDYAIERDTVGAHLGALDKVYDGVISSNRKAIEELDDLDLVTQDLIIGQTGELEKFQWFVRAHLESFAGELKDAGTATEKDAAAKTRKV